ncbi:protein kinase domain-containing protein [Paludibaculum fermentans]|uniref:protein kinase domain-containing protein n=1 Tax=Paludibaculum fermentans TaxID=1473598 RepID=UPI002B271D10|nr:protein kinase [Paludibaculum fermentans]
MERIGKYEIAAELGRGGFGRVYRAFDPVVSRPVAIKVLTESADAAMLARFRNEASAAGNLHHKNIVTIHDFGEDRGMAYIVMELLEGEDLNEAIHRKRELTLLQKMHVMSQVAEGLHCAHANGVLHRDVKPANIMLLPDLTVKIMDFGIARLVDGEGTRLTQQGYLVGSIPYMSPEQFLGAETDGLCDIFAYGVIYYELLTGKHPFSGPTAPAVMASIMNQEPRSLKEYLSECPPALAEVVHRAMAKDRSLRYQSIEECRLDAEPIMMELQYEEAVSLLSEAQGHFVSGEFNAASKILKRVLELDPGNRSARRLRENVREATRRQALKHEVDALRSKGHAELQSRRFQDAVRWFENALALDPSNSQLIALVEQARSLLEQSRRAAELITSAKKGLEHNDLTGAFKHASEAAESDPENPEAMQLLDEIRRQMQERDRGQRLKAELSRVQAMFLMQSIDEAIAALTDLSAKFPGSPEVASSMERAQVLKKEQLHRQRLQQYLDATRQLLRENRLEEALVLAEGLAKEFPDHREVVGLLGFIRDELRLKQKAEFAAATAGDAVALRKGGQYAQAVERLEDGLRQYPGEQLLLETLQATIADWSAYKRRAAVSEAVQGCQELIEKQMLAEALHLIDSSLNKFAGDESLLQLRRDAEAALAQQRRTQAIRGIEEDARSYLKGGRPGKAIPLLRHGIVRFPGEPLLLSLLEEAEQAIQALQQAEAFERMRQRLRELTSACDFEQARSVLDQGARDFPERGEAIRSLLTETAAAKRAWEREQALERELAKADSLFRRGFFEEALDVTREALAAHPGSARLRELRAKIEAGWAKHQRDQAVRQVVEEAQRQLGEDRVSEAIATLEGALARFPGDSQIQPLMATARQRLQIAQQAGEVEKIRAQATGLAARENYSEAIQLLNQAIQLYPDAAVLRETHKAVCDSQEAWRKRQAVARALEEAAALRDRGSLDQALQMVGDALHAHPQEPELLSIRAQLAEEKAQQKKSAAVKAAVGEAERLLAGGQAAAAAARLEQGCAEYPGEPELEALLAKARAAAQQRARLDQLLGKVNAQVQANDLDAAVRSLEAGVQSFPGEEQIAARLVALRADRAAQERNREIEEAVAKAGELRQSERYSEGVELLRSLPKEYASDPRLQRLERELSDGLKIQKRNEAVRAVEADAQALIRRGDFAGASQILGKAATVYAGEAALTKLLFEAQQGHRRKQELEQAVEEARALRAQGRHEEAQSQLEAWTQRWGAHPAVTEMAAEVRMEAERLRRDTAIADGEAEARSLIAKGDFEGALRVLDGLTARYPDLPALVQLRESAAASLEAKRKQAEIGRVLAGAEQEIGKGHFAEAQRILRDGLRSHSRNGEMEALLKKAAAAQAAAELQQSILMVVQDVKDLRSQGKTEDALRRANRGLKELGRQPLLVELQRIVEGEVENRRQLAEIAAAARDAEARLKAGDASSAARDLRNALQRFPANKELEALLRSAELQLAEQKRALERAEAVATAIREADENCGAGRFTDALRRLDQARQTVGADPALQAKRDDIAARIEAQRREHRRQATLAQARSTIAAGQLIPGRQALEAFVREEGNDAEVAALLAEALSRIRQAEQAATLERVRLEARTLTEREDFAGAIQALEAGLREFPGERSLTELLQRATAARQAQVLSQAIGAAIDEANRLRQKQKFTDALRRIERAVKESGPDPRLAAVQQEVSAELEQHKRAEELRKAEKAAKSLIDKGRCEEALEALARSRAQFPDEPSLASLAEIAAERSLQKAREAAAAKVNKLGQTAANVREPGKLQARLEEVRLLAAPFSADREFKLLTEAAIAQIQAALQGLEPPKAATSPPLSGPPAPATTKQPVALAAAVPAGVEESSPSEPAKAPLIAGIPRWAAAAVVVVALIGGTVAIRRMSHAGKETATEGSAAGGPKQTAIPEPPPPILELTTNLAEATVQVDNRPAGKLENGQFRLTEAAPGKHTLRISGPDGNASLSFEVHRDAMPGLANLINSNELKTVAVASFAGKIRLLCNCAGQPVAVDGKPSGVMKPPALEVASMRAGTHELKVGNGSPLVLMTHDSPSMNLFLTANRDVGTLVVETNESGADVVVGSRRYTSRGLLQLPLESKSYTVRVEKPGYDTTGQQSVELHRGEVLRLSFRLTPREANLELAGLAPNAEVLVDGRQHGLAGADGRYSGRLPSGEHTIDLRKDGFTPRQIASRFDPGSTVRFGPERTQMQEIRKPASPPPPVESPKPADPRALEAQEWASLQNTRDTSALEEFRRKFPNGPHAEEAGHRIEQVEWAGLSSTRDVAALDAFQKKYPNGRFAAEAARAVEKIEWDNLNKSNKADLESFLQKHPRGANSQQARDELAKFAGASQSKADEQAILALVSRYSAAFAAKNADQVRALWPSIPSQSLALLKTAFKNAVSIDLQLQPESAPVISGSKASVVCARSMTQRYKDGAPPAARDRVTIGFVKQGDAWSISSIQ